MRLVEWWQLCVLCCAPADACEKFLLVARFQIHFFFLGDLYFFSPQHKHTHSHSTIHKIAQRVLFFLFVWCVLYIQRCRRAIYIYDLFNTQRSKCNTDPCFPFFFTIDYTPVSVCLFRFFFFPCTNKRSRAHPHLAIFSIL